LGINAIAVREGKSPTDVQNDLAEELGYSPATIEWWRRGNPPDSKLVMCLADKFVDQGGLSEKWRREFLKLAGLNPDLPCPSDPRDLPARSQSFLGRERELQSILKALKTTQLILLEGIAGVGKTSLALEVAYACKDEPRGAAATLTWPRFDFIVWISVGELKFSLNDLLDTLADRLEATDLIRRHFIEKRTGVRRILTQKRTLLLLDNFEMVTDPVVFDFLTSLPERVKVLLISREGECLLPASFHRHPSYDHIHLDGLQEAEALSFLRNEAQRYEAVATRPTVRERLRDVIEAEDRTLLRLVKVTSGNPKAMSLALGYVANEDLPLSTVVQRLSTEAHSEGTLFHIFFAQGWDRCTEEARAVWRVIPFFAAPARREALQAAAGLQDDQFQDAVDQLEGRSFLEALNGPRYRAHQLVRTFAKAKLRDTPDFEVQARIRWSQHLLDFAAGSVVRAAPKERYWNALPTDQSIKNIDPEWRNLLNVLEWADQKKQNKILIELVMLLVHYMDQRVLFSKRLYYARKAAEAAQELGQSVDEAILRIDALGFTLIYQADFTKAEQEIKRGLDIAQNLSAEKGDEANDLIALAHAFLARLCLLQGDLTKASASMAMAVSTSRRPWIQSRIEAIAGDIALQKGDGQEAVKLYTDSLRTRDQYGGEGIGADMRSQLGFAYLLTGDLERAEDAFNQVVSNKRLRNTLQGMYAKYGLAKIALQIRDTAKARELAQEVLDRLCGLDIDRNLQYETEKLLSSLEEIGDSRVDYSVGLDFAI
jgi:LuxR family glucitol operon transcriptional activator